MRGALGTWDVFVIVSATAIGFRTITRGFTIYLWGLGGITAGDVIEAILGRSWRVISLLDGGRGRALKRSVIGLVIHSDILLMGFLKPLFHCNVLLIRVARRVDFMGWRIVIETGILAAVCGVGLIDIGGRFDRLAVARGCGGILS